MAHGELHNLFSTCSTAAKKLFYIRFTRVITCNILSQQELEEEGVKCVACSLPVGLSYVSSAGTWW